ncbi:uncharacterized protein LOC121681481 [Alosa sapidissima]|uniref:uncharacterized protein LOC121681481 n=1 Tax=Alosa sapidissima TaxID=34773 RepID=UPI001C089F03|nr:uncharacterized protein LOC121681481 [Alosa sapidissima]
MEGYARRMVAKKNKCEGRERTAAAQTLLLLSTYDSDKDTDSAPELDDELETQLDTQPAPNPSTNCVSTQTDIDMEYMDELDRECQALRSENLKIKEDIARLSLQEDTFRANEGKVKLLTGLPNYQCLLTMLTLIGSHLGNVNILSPFQQLLMTMMRLRFNLHTQFLAFILGVSTSTISRTFNNVINALYVKLVPLMIVWPDREELRKTLPTSFRVTFPKCTSVIDCFEIFVERASSLQARAQTYSNYKHHNTVKCFISITPQGTISFISRGYGGRASDKYITEHSGYLAKLNPGDVVLADRGFDLKDTFALYGAKLVIPIFTKGKTQLSSEDIEKSRNISKVRIHVERVIGLTRQKYTILETIIPITLLQTDTVYNVTSLDKIVHVSCALVNMCRSDGDKTAGTRGLSEAAERSVAWQRQPQPKSQKQVSKRSSELPDDVSQHLL